jgi:hypothetical protein
MIPNLSDIGRLADALADSATVLAQYDPHFAAVQSWFATALAGHAAIAPMIPATVQSSPPPRMSRHAQVEAARRWYIEREADWPAGEAPPSGARDIADAKIALPFVARAVITRLRPPSWALKRGHRPQIPAR